MTDEFAVMESMESMVNCQAVVVAVVESVVDCKTVEVSMVESGGLQLRCRCGCEILNF